MTALIGIDEAGYGPLLGPLVVSSVAFQIPEHSLKDDLWQLLKKSTSQTKRNLAGRLQIADSKKVYSRAAGITHLQRSILACLKCLGHKPKNISQLISLLCPETLKRLKNYPWYETVQNQPLQFDPADIDIASAVFGDSLIENNIKLLKIQSCCLDVAHYNASVEKTKNKANVLFTATATLVKHAFDNLPQNQLQVIVDRQGARANYVNHIQKMFPDLDLKVLKQTEKISSYQLTSPKKTMRIHFVIKADQKHLPVSLASMTSKYLRQLLVGCINTYFASHCDHLKPTQGYWKDGLRFIADLKTHIPHVKYDGNLLIRSR